MTKQLTAAERFRQTTADLTPDEEIVDLIAPSGFVYKFAKPNAMGMIFGLGHVPMGAASHAIEQWRKDGVIKESDVEDLPDTDTMKLFELTLRTRDRVIELSREPKLVMGVANEANGELSTDEIERRCPADLAFLFEWVQSGGTKATTFANFPDGQPASPLAQPNRQARRAAAKRAGGDK